MWSAVYLRGGCVYGSLTGELLEADEGILDDLAAGYDRWIALFRNGLRLMRRRGDLTESADPRHLAVSLVAAHQGGTLLTFATGTAEPLRAVLEAAVDYVESFDPNSAPAGVRHPTPVVARPSRKGSKFTGFDHGEPLDFMGDCTQNSGVVNPLSAAR